MYEERIIIDPEIRHGKPIIKGTRVPVDIILGSLVGGMNIEEITKEYGIEKEDNSWLFGWWYEYRRNHKRIWDRKGRCACCNRICSKSNRKGRSKVLCVI